jgi:hypothetical protein
MDTLSQLFASCGRAEEFPINGTLIGPNTNLHTLEALHSELMKRKQALFCEDEAQTGVHFWETAEAQIAGNLRRIIAENDSS